MPVLDQALLKFANIWLGVRVAVAIIHNTSASLYCLSVSEYNAINQLINAKYYKLLHLLFGVLRIFGTLMEWNRRQSHDCSDYPDFRVGAARTDT